MQSLEHMGAKKSADTLIIRLLRHSKGCQWWTLHTFNELHFGDITEVVKWFQRAWEPQYPLFKLDINNAVWLVDE